MQLNDNKKNASSGNKTYLDLDQVDWLQVSWRSSQHTGVGAASGSWDDLTASSMDGVSM